MTEPIKLKADADAGGADVLDTVNEYIRRFGEHVSADLPALDGEGYTDLRHGSIIIGINVIQQRGILLFLVRMGDLPDPPQPGLYRRLLQLNLLSTGDCAFAVDEERGGIYLRAMRTLEALDYAEFEDLLQTIVVVAERMGERLEGLLSGA